VKRVGIVGAGLGGLSAAVQLAHHGYEVNLYDQQSFTGGKAGVLSLENFRFDTGPSLLTMPDVFRQLFAEVGAEMDEYLKLVRLNPLCCYYFADGTSLSTYSDPRRTAEEIGAKSRDSAARVLSFFAYSRRIYELSAELFLHKSLHEPSTYADWKTLRSLMLLGRIDPLRSMDQANRSFFRDPRIVQLFNRYATYNGSDPYRLPATFNLIPHVEYEMGGYAVRGGIGALPRALTRLAEERGVHIHTGVPVEGIQIADQRVRGLTVEGITIPYDVVVSNADVLTTYGRLLKRPQSRWARRYCRLQPSSSALVFYWGLKRTFNQLNVHNIFFSADYRKEFEHIFLRGECPRDPSVYVNITSKVDPSDAPPNAENWFVMINVPPHRGQDWESIAAGIRPIILRRIEAALGTAVEAHIVAESVLTPADIERTGSAFGSLYGLSSNNRLSAFYRHPNRSRRFRGLYFCGGSAHPGGGMPLAVLSGKIAAELVRRYEG
jgi:diapolycopene oxygenase